MRPRPAAAESDPVIEGLEAQLLRTVQENATLRAERDAARASYKVLQAETAAWTGRLVERIETIPIPMRPAPPAAVHVHVPPARLKKERFLRDDAGRIVGREEVALPEPEPTPPAESAVPVPPVAADRTVSVIANGMPELAERVGGYIDAIPDEAVRLDVAQRGWRVMLLDPTTADGCSWTPEDGTFPMTVLVVRDGTVARQVVLHEAAHVARRHRPATPEEYARDEDEAKDLAFLWANQAAEEDAS